MTFEERLDSLLKDRAVNKKAFAEQIGMPYSTFLYKAKEIERWNILEFDSLAKQLHLTDDEIDFLYGKVKCG